MRVLIAISCLLAVASATWAGYSPAAYHIPTIGPHGVPLDEPAVAHAKAAHFAAHAEAAARAGGYGHGNAIAPAHYAPATKWYGPIHIPVIGPHGVPIDEPAVQHARAEHLAAHAGGGHLYAGLGHYGGYGVVAQVPHDTPEVAAAKAAHFAAHAEAASRGGYGGHYRRRRGIYGGYQGPLPVIGHDGVPQDEPAVAAAKAHHFQAYNEAAARNSIPAHHGVPAQAHYGVPQGVPSHYEQPQRPWHGPIHIPVLDHNGVPVEPHEVQAARASHLAALNDAHARSGGHYYH